MFTEKYISMNEPRYLDDAVVRYRAAVNCSLASPVQRSLAARIWARSADDSHHNSALEAYKAAIQLLPSLAALNLTVKARQQILVWRTDGLGPDAAACAIRNGQFDTAIELLEEARTVFWSQSIKLQMLLGNLRRQHPTQEPLADRFERLSRQLRQGSFRGIFSTLPDQKLPIEKDNARYRELHQQWLDSISEIRNLDGFDGFLRPKTWLQLSDAVVNRLVVILVGSKYGCSALLIHSRNIQHIPLEISYQEVKDMAETLQTLVSAPGSRPMERPSPIRNPTEVIFKNTLTRMWNEIVHPVVHKLQLEVPLFHLLHFSPSSHLCRKGHLCLVCGGALLDRLRSCRSTQQGHILVMATRFSTLSFRLSHPRSAYFIAGNQ